LQQAIDEAKRDWRDELMWAGFGERLDAHSQWAMSLLGPSAKLPAHLFLEKLGVPYEPRDFPISTEKGAASVAHVLGFAERQAVKTLIFQADTGEKVLIMLGGDQSAVSGNLKKAIGSRNIRMAAPEIVKETTGYVIGSIPPFGWQSDGFRSFLERSLMSEAILGVGAGEWGKEIMITPEYLKLAAHAIVANLTEAGTPVLQE
jgi:Cys-tRNA(Pro)/Cys-tRNA(Cys) deacylase